LRWRLYGRLRRGRKRTARAASPASRFTPTSSCSRGSVRRSREPYRSRRKPLRHNQDVRIADEHGNQLDRVYIALTDSEAKQLHDFLEQLMVEKPFHAHVMDDRFWTTNEAEHVEKEVVISRADDPDVGF
jgi:hypothetical protein